MATGARGLAGRGRGRGRAAPPAGPAAEPPARVPIVALAGRRGLAVPLEAFKARLGGQQAFRRMLGAFEVVEEVRPGRPRGMGRAVRKAYKIDRGAGLFIIPRLKGPPFLRPRAPIIDIIIPGPDALPEPRTFEAAVREPAAPLYDYQEAVVDHLLGPGGPLSAERVASCQGTAYLEMGPGLGKTRLGLALIAARGEPALVVVPTEAIGAQWVDECRALFPGLRVGFYHNPTARSARAPPGPATHDVIVVIINTFREKDPDWMEGYGTVVLDEAHEYHSPHNGKALWLAQTRAVLGLSATPRDRPDGLDRYVTYHLGAPIRTEDIPRFDVSAVNFRAEVREIVYGGHPDHCETVTTPLGVMSAVLTVDSVLDDPHRLRLVAAEAARLYHLHRTAGPEQLAAWGLGPRPAEAATPDLPAGGIRRHGVLVFAELRKYLPALRAALLAHVPPEDLDTPELDGEGGDQKPAGAAAPPISTLMGGVPQNAVSCARGAGAHVVLTTYGYSRRGISLTAMTSVILASSRRNGMRQILGRVFRRGSDESIVRQIVDIVDSRTGLRGQATDRRKLYAERGYPVTRLAVEWSDLAADDPAADVGVVAGAPEAPDEQALADMPAAELLALCLSAWARSKARALGASPAFVSRRAGPATRRRPPRGRCPSSRGSASPCRGRRTGWAPRGPRWCRSSLSPCFPATAPRRTPPRGGTPALSTEGRTRARG